MQSNLRPGLHCMQIASDANLRAKLIFKFFLSRDPHNLTRAFVTYVRPLLSILFQYGDPILKAISKQLKMFKESLRVNSFVCVN